MSSLKKKSFLQLVPEEEANFLGGGGGRLRNEQVETAFPNECAPSPSPSGSTERNEKTPDSVCSDVCQDAHLEGSGKHQVFIGEKEQRFPHPPRFCSWGPEIKQTKDRLAREKQSL